MGKVFLMNLKSGRESLLHGPADELPNGIQAESTSRFVRPPIVPISSNFQEPGLAIFAIPDLQNTSHEINLQRDCPI